MEWNRLFYKSDFFTKLNSDYTLKNKAMNLRIRGLFLCIKR